MEKEEDKKAPEGEKPEGNADNAAPDKKDESGNAGENKEEKSETNLEEETYKERFAKSQKEVQENLLPQIKVARKKLGLGENDPIIEEDDEGEEKKETEEKEEKDEEKEDEKDDEKKEIENKDDEEKAEETEKKEVPLGITPLRSNDPVTQTLYDEIWTSVSNDDREDMNTDPNTRETMVKNFPIFLKDSEGNVKPYRQALIETYEYVNRESIRKKEFEKGRLKGLLEGKNTNGGTMKNTSSRQPDSGKKLTITQDQQRVARGLGITDEEYLEQKQKINE